MTLLTARMALQATRVWLPWAASRYHYLVALDTDCCMLAKRRELRRRRVHVGEHWLYCPMLLNILLR
jgi:hypothetical protein